MTHPRTVTQPADRRELAWTAAKLAVRSYARDPSSQNAGAVKQAWAQVRRVTADSARLRLAQQPQASAAGLH